MNDPVDVIATQYHITDTALLDVLREAYRAGMLRASVICRRRGNAHRLASGPQLEAWKCASRIRNEIGLSGEPDGPEVE